jgi:type II secretory pathway component PulJ
MTLVEVLISGALISVVMASVYVLYIAMHDTLYKGELKADLQQNARVGLAQMTQEIRMAGYDPEGAIPLVSVSPKGAIRAATPGCLMFVGYKKEKDPPNSGNYVDKSKQFTYYLDGTTLRYRMDDWRPNQNKFSGGSGDPLAYSVSLLNFTYYDANSQVLVPAIWTPPQPCPPNATSQPTEQLTFEQMRQIRRVAITLKACGCSERAFACSDPQCPYETSFTLTSDVHLRNL